MRNREYVILNEAMDSLEGGEDGIYSMPRGCLSCLGYKLQAWPDLQPSPAKYIYIYIYTHTHTHTQREWICTA